MHRRHRVSVFLLLIVAALLAACGGSSNATNTPSPAAPTTGATRPASSVVVATNAPTAAADSAAGGTRPVASVVTNSTVAVGSASALIGTRPAGSVTTGSATAGGTTAAGSSVAGAGLVVFSDPMGRFSFSRPAVWTVGQSTSSNTVVQFDATNPPGVIDISTESVPASATPEMYRAAALDEIMKAIPDAQQVGTLDLQLDGEPAIQIDYTGTVSGNKIYFSQIFALHKGTAYILTIGTQPADIETVKQQAVVLVQTWKFLQ